MAASKAEDVNPQLKGPGGASRKRGRETPTKSSDKPDTPLDGKDIANLTTFLKQEESALRARAKEILNKDLISQAEAFGALEERLDGFTCFQEALEAGFTADVSMQLTKLYRVGIKLEAWINTFTPPLAAGGNLGVSGEVQDGIFSHAHSLTAQASEALHRALAFEKEYAVQKTKCDAATWERYRKTLEANMLHDLTKSIMQAQGDILNLMNSITNNLMHLRPPADEKPVTMY